MFNKLYKEANDEIQINAALKEELIRKASAEPVKKADRHTVIVRRVGFAATAAAVIALSFTAMPYIKDNFSGDSSYIGTGTEQETKTSVQPAESAEPSNELPKTTAEGQAAESHPDDTVTSGNGNTANKIDNNTGTSQKPAASKKNQAAVTENTAAPTGTTAPAAAAAPEVPTAEKQYSASAEQITEQTEPQMFSIESAEAEPEVPAGYADEALITAKAASGSSGSDMGVAANSSRKQSDMTLSEYCVYYGFDLSGINLPQGMSLSDGKTAKPGRNHTVTYSGNGKNVSVTLVLDSSEAEQQSENSSGKSYNGAVVSKTSDTHYKIYSADKGLIIDSNGLNEKEVYKLIDSLK